MGSHCSSYHSGSGGDGSIVVALSFVGIVIGLIIMVVIGTIYYERCGGTCRHFKKKTTVQCQYCDVREQTYEAVK